MSWEPINLVHVEPRPATRPTIGGADLVYPGKRHVFSGPPESAKTLAAYAIALQEIRLGGSVLLIDFEMGPWDARDRLREMGATDEELGRFLYVEPETPASVEIVEDIAEQWTFSLAILDTAAGAYSLQGLDDNLRRDVEIFASVYVRTFWLRQVATLLIDHVAKKADSRGAFAIGSERKIGGVDVHLGFEIALPLTRGSRGLYKVLTHKDRLGHLPRPRAAEFEVRSDPVSHEISWTFRQPQEASPDTPWQPTRLMEKVSRWLENQRDEVSRNLVEESVTGKGQFVRAALDALIAGGWVAETAGIRGSRPVRSVEPYRESDPKSTSSRPRPDLVPEGSHHLVPRPPLYKGDEDEVGVHEGDAVGSAATDDDRARRFDARYPPSAETP